MRCENVFRPHCGRDATNAVPMFMGSVWMCPRCSLEIAGDDDIHAPERAYSWTAPDPQEWERLDRETWGLA